MVMIIAKFVCLFLAVAYGFTCVGRVFKGQQVHTLQTFLMAFGAAGFILLQWVI